jgi:hypothetical protein
MLRRRRRQWRHQDADRYRVIYSTYCTAYICNFVHVFMSMSSPTMVSVEITYLRWVPKSWDLGPLTKGTLTLKNPNPTQITHHYTSNDSTVPVPCLSGGESDVQRYRRDTVRIQMEASPNQNFGDTAVTPGSYRVTEWPSIEQYEKRQKCWVQYQCLYDWWGTSEPITVRDTFSSKRLHLGTVCWRSVYGFSLELPMKYCRDSNFHTNSSSGARR